MPITLNGEEQEVIGDFLANPAEESFRRLFRVLSPQIFAYFRFRGCERTLAEDLAQEVMLAVYTQSSQLRHRDMFRPWVFRIARNAWLQHLRHEHRQIATTTFEGSPDHLSAREGDPVRESLFAEWMEWLSPEDRELVLMRYVEGLAYHEIAAALGIPLGTAQWRVFQLKRKLAARFGVPPL
jgi:RNA polymerase sigma-70 factor (ECF subfamily)